MRVPALSTSRDRQGAVTPVAYALGSSIAWYVELQSAVGYVFLPMLDRLDEIPWHTLTYAYGKASDTPGLIRRLASSSRLVRSHARDQLWFSIVHQGSVYDSSGYAVPFLVELAASPDMQDGGEIPELLSAIACGCGWAQAHRRLILVQNAFTQEQLDEQEAAERGWLARIRDAFTEALPSLLTLLGDPDLSVRMSGAKLLAGVRQEVPPVVEAMKRAYERESDMSARANLVLSVASLARKDELQFLRGAFDAHTAEPIVRVAAAVGIVDGVDGEPSRDVIQFLLDAISPIPNELEAAYDRLPMRNDDCPGKYLADIAWSLAVAPEATRSAAAQRVVEEIESRDVWNDMTIGPGMLRLALFPLLQGDERARELKPKFSVETLDGVQRRAIACVARRAWHGHTIFGNAVDVLQSHGLPGKPEEVEALVGRDVWAVPQGFRPRPPRTMKRWWQFW